MISVKKVKNMGFKIQTRQLCYTDFNADFFSLIITL